MPVRLFIDSADVDLLARTYALGVFSGVTTTPTLFSQQSVKDPTACIRRICSLTLGEVHIEALGSSAEEIIAVATQNHKLCDRIVAKIPMSAEGIRAVGRLRQAGIRTNVHLVYSVNQAILAAEAGADYVCPLIGRLGDTGGKPMALVKDIVRMSKQYGYKVQTMASSIRSPDDVRRSLKWGVDAITIPPIVVEKMIRHPLTDLGAETFRRDARLAAQAPEVMRPSDQIPKLTEEGSLLEALNLMTEKGLGICVVVDAQGQLAGVVTEGGVRSLLIRGCAAVLDEPVSGRMERSPAVATGSATASDVRQAMQRERVTAVVVVDDSRHPVGVVDARDL